MEAFVDIYSSLGYDRLGQYPIVIPFIHLTTSVCVEYRTGLPLTCKCTKAQPLKHNPHSITSSPITHLENHVGSHETRLVRCSIGLDTLHKHGLVPGNLHPVAILVLVDRQLQRLGRVHQQVTGRRRQQRLRPPRTSAVHRSARWPRWPELARTLPMVVMQVERRPPQLRVLVVVVVVVGIGQSV